MTEPAADTDRIEQKLQATRARLDATLDALQQKLSPSEVVDQAMGYLKEGAGAEFSRNLLVSVRENPIPVALVGIGLTWLMLTSSRGRTRTARAEPEDTWLEERERYGDLPYLPEPATGSAFGAADTPPPETGYATAPSALRSSDPWPEDQAAYGAAGTDERWEGDYLSTHGAYSSAAIEDLAGKADAAGRAVSRDPGELEEVYEERVYAARGGVLGLKRNVDEPHRSFRDRVDAALSAAAQRYARMREQALEAGSDLAARGQSVMQNVYERGQAAASGAYGYGRSAAGAAVDYGRAAAEGAYDYGSVAVRHVRDNPLPWLLIGAGVAWLATSGRLGGLMGGGQPRVTYEPAYGRDRLYGTGYRSTTAGYPGPGYPASSYPRAGYGRTGTGPAYRDDTAGGGTVDDLASRAQEAGAAIQRRADETEEAFSERVYDAKARVLGVGRSVNEAFASFRSRVDSALEAAGDRYERWRRQAAEAGRDMAAYGQDMAQSVYGYGRSAALSARDMGGRTIDYVQEQPVLLGALGFAVGALLGMLMPSSRYERELVGNVRDDVRERVRDAASEAMRGAERVARDVMGTARETAERERLGELGVSGVAHQARERAHDAAERVRHVVEETAAAGREAVARELGGGSNTGSGGPSTGGKSAGSTPAGSGTGTSNTGAASTSKGQGSAAGSSSPGSSSIGTTTGTTGSGDQSRRTPT